ncbi:MAG: stage V sporulation protein AD [Oscillospiraceae bacterium]
MKNTFIFNNPVSVKAYSSTVGPKESKGPMAEYFDTKEDDSYFGQDTWEQAESYMQKITIQNAIKKASLKSKDINFMFAGDLINQCMGTTYGIRDLNIPVFSIYGACSTMSEGLLLSSMMVNGGYGDYVLCSTSSHFSTAERQFRFPLSYGGQRTPTSQWTCTASGAVIVSNENNAPFVRGGTVGKIVDLGINDANNMGAAMAPAAADTIATFLTDTGFSADYFDCIVTGDLGIVGSSLLIDLLKKQGIDISDNHKDCGVMMFDIDEQDVHAGGSGCGCSASILCGYFLPRIASGEIKHMLFAATGALLSPVATQQGETIPSVSHLVWVENSYQPTSS